MSVTVINSQSRYPGAVPPACLSIRGSFTGLRMTIQEFFALFVLLVAIPIPSSVLK
jgi:hypothetical protein